MRALAKSRVTEKQFKELPFAEKFKYCISEPERYEKLLTNTEEIQYRRIIEVYHLTHKCISNTNAIKIVQYQISGAEDWKIANKLVKDAQDIMSPFVQINKLAKRIAVSERLFAYAELLEEEGKLLESSIVQEKAIKIGGYDKDDDSGIDWDLLQIPASEYSTDPALLNEAFDEAEEIADDEEEEDA
jgi:hypothetical protein